MTNLKTAKFNPEKFASLLNSYIERQNLTNKQLAEQIGVSAMAICKWRGGKLKKGPHCENVCTCADVLMLNTSTERPEFFGAAGCEDDPPNFYFVPVVSRPIWHPAQFFGRYSELDRISHYWDRPAPSHLMIWGPKQSGKTSLLNYLRNFRQPARNIFRPGQPYPLPRTKFDWVFIDFCMEEMQTPKGVWRHILKSLRLPTPKDLDFSAFNEILGGSFKRLTVIAMDRLDKGLHSNSLGLGFWDNLRSLACHQENLVFCVAVRDEQEVRKKLMEGQASSFGNIFTAMELGRFSDDEARELLSYAPVQFSEAETVWVLEQTQRWPVLLQIFCQMRWDDESGTEWQNRGREELNRYECLLKRSHGVL